MKQGLWKKAVCVGLLSMAALFSGCGSAHKVAVVDYQRLEAESPKIQAIEKEIRDKDTEIRNRLASEAESTSAQEMNQKVQAAQQERMIFIQSKQKQMESMIEAQCAALAKEKSVGIVMHSRAVPVGAIDITDEVLSRLEPSAKPAGGTKK